MVRVGLRSWIHAAIALSLVACGATDESSNSRGVLPPPDHRASGEVLDGATNSVMPNAVVNVALGKIEGVFFRHANWRSADFYVNGIDVGTVETDNYLRLELRPGVYTFSWRVHDAAIGPVRTSANNVQLEPGRTVNLALSIGHNAGTLLGPIGWWADPDTGHMTDLYPRGQKMLLNRRPVMPSTATLAQLHPLAGPMTNLPQSW